METNKIINIKQFITITITIGLIALFMRYPFQYSITYTGKDKSGIKTVTEQIDYTGILNYIVLVATSMIGGALTHKLRTPPAKKENVVRTRYPYRTSFTRYSNKFLIEKEEKESVGTP